MARDKKKGKKKGKNADVYNRDWKYYCSDCHVEVPMKQACPSCSKEIDWDRV